MDMAISNINGIGSKVQDIPSPGSVSGNSTPQKESSAQVTEEFMKLDNDTVKQLIEKSKQSAIMNISLSFSAYGNDGEIRCCSDLKKKQVRYPEIPPGSFRTYIQTEE